MAVDGLLTTSQAVLDYLRQRQLQLAMLSGGKRDRLEPAQHQTNYATS